MKNSFVGCVASWRRIDSQEITFFSEEKNQKTFIPPLADESGPWPGSCRKRRNKSLFASFSSEKEEFFLAWGQAAW
jgi:hypothetical protein